MEPARLDVSTARQKSQSGALLACAYEKPRQFRRARLEGAISYPELRTRLGALAKDAEVIFYCA